MFIENFVEMRFRDSDGEEEMPEQPSQMMEVPEQQEDRNQPAIAKAVSKVMVKALQEVKCFNLFSF